MSFTNRQNTSKGILFFVFLLFMILLPIIFPNPARLGMFIACGVATVLASGWLLILRIGYFSIGQVAFLGTGAYTSALLAQKLGVNPWWGLLWGGVLSGLIALGIGLIFLKIRGLYFSIVTFAFAEVFRLGVSLVDFLGGHAGVLEIPKYSPISVPGWGVVRFESPFNCYYLLLGIVLISSIFMWRMDRSALGRTFKSLTQNEELAASLGINTLYYKATAFVTASFFAGVAGAFTAHYYGCLYPGSYGVMQSVFVQIQGTVGGAASVVFGGFLGGSLMVITETFLLNVDARWISIFYGAVIIIITFVLPDGLLSLPQEIRRYRDQRKSKNR